MALLDWLVRTLKMERDDWPPPAMKAHWDAVALYREYFDLDKERMAKRTGFDRTAEKKKLFTPVPLAAEICGYSADLLFSEEPDITFEGETEQGLLEEILEANGLAAFLLESAAKIATEGRGALRVIRDDESADVPIITHVSEDMILWDVRHGRFVSGGYVVIPWKNNRWSEDVYRLVEEHRPGYVERTLFKGRGASLGSEVPLASVDRFAGLEERTETGLDRPTLIRWDNVPGGRSDIAGQLTLLDRLNEFESLGVDKVRKSQPVTLVDRRLADKNGAVDLNGIVFTGGRSEVAGEGVAKTVETIQPDLQAEEHLRFVEHVRNLIVTTSGYSLESFGEATDGRADSGRALKLRMTRTLLKKAGKDRMAREAMRTALATCTAWELGASSIREYLPKVELGDGLPRDELDLAQVIATMEGAGAISTQTKVRMFHPDWTEEEIEAEVAAIDGQNAPPQITVPRLSLEDPTSGEPAEPEE